MSAVKDAIIWLDAFTQSIDGDLPSDKQWKKIMAKVGELSKLAKAGKADDIAVAAPPAAAPVAADRDPSEPIAAPPKLVDFKPKTQKSATALYIQALLDSKSCDQETAEDLARDYRWDKDIPPEEQAREDLVKYGIKGAA